MPDIFALWTSALLVSCPLPFSFPGTFLKTLPETENQAKTVFPSISPAFAGERGEFSREGPFFRDLSAAGTPPAPIIFLESSANLF